MDVSKKYIKMCEKAKEIQKLWKYENGDWYASQMTKEGYFIGVVSKDYEKLCSNTQVEAPYYQEYSEYCIWLPRQDQLQEIIIDKYKDYEEDKYIQLTFEFYAFIGSGRKRKGIRKLYSMEQLLLAFVMYKRYGKIWNDKEEKWIEEEL